MKFKDKEYRYNKRSPSFLEKDHILILPVAIPGSGKSTICQEYKTKYPNLRIISPDEIRFEILDSEKTGKYFDPSIEEKVWGKAFHLLYSALESGVPIYFDATNTIRKYRTKLITSAHLHEYHIEICRIKTPFWAAWLWNRRRVRKVPDEVMKRMSAYLNEPLIHEYETLRIVKPSLSIHAFISFLKSKYLKRKLTY